MPRDLLTPFPTVAPQGPGAPGMSGASSSAPFGAAVANAQQGLGSTVVGAAGLAFDQAAKEQGMINETNATNAETQFVKSLNERMAVFKQKQGLQAVSDQEAAGTDIAKLREEIAEGLPNEATRRAFTTLSRRYETNAISEIRTYATGQLKQADITSAQASIANSIARSGMVDVATNPKEFGDTLGDIEFQTIRMMQTQGWGNQMVPQQGGGVSFLNTPEGQQAKAVYDEAMGKYVGKAWETRLELLATQNITGAYKVFQDNRDKIPGATNAKLEQWFAPKILQAVAQEQGDKWLGRGGPGQLPGVQAVSTPGAAPRSAVPPPEQRAVQPAPVEQYNSPTGSTAFNLGNVKTPEGARAGTPDFVKPQTPEDGVALAATTLRRGYQNMTIAEIGKKWEGTPNYRTWVTNVSKVTGWTEETVPDLNDPGQLSTLLKGIAVAEKSPKDRMYFTPETIGRGVDQALSGKPAITMERAATLANISAAYKDDPKLGKAVAQYVSDQYSIMATVATAAEQAKRQEVEKAYDGYVSAILKMGVAGIKPDEVQKMTLQIANDPVLTGEKKQTAYNMLQAQLSNSGASTDRTLGSNYIALWKRVHADQSDPERITDPQQIYKMVDAAGKELSPQGAQSLVSAITGRRTPDGEAEQSMRAQFFRNARAQISGANDGLGIKDPKGEELMLRFQAQAEAAYAAGRRDGKSAYQLLNPDSPDYIGKSIATFKRPMSVFMQDMMNNGAGLPGSPSAATASGPGAQTAQAEAEKYSTPEALIRAVQSGALSRAEGERIALERGYIRAKAAAPAPPVR